MTGDALGCPGLGLMAGLCAVFRIGKMLVQPADDMMNLATQQVQIGDTSILCIGDNGLCVRIEHLILQLLATLHSLKVVQITICDQRLNNLPVPPARVAPCGDGRQQHGPQSVPCSWRVPGSAIVELKLRNCGYQQTCLAATRCACSLASSDDIQAESSCISRSFSCQGACQHPN